VSERCFGLKGIRERARLLGGRASIETTIGEGTRLVVELPLVERSRQAE
jgi:signal transduction histidine kinase